MLGIVLIPFGVPSRELAPLSHTLMDVAREWGVKELSPGHPDRDTMEKLAAHLSQP